MILGYCTNVHAGATLEETRASLERHAVRVRDLVSPQAPLPIGLWLSSRAAHGLTEDPDGARRLRDWLIERGLRVFSLNGFPYGDFHQERVKELVYLPHWGDARRVEYTIQLADILTDLLPEGSAEGSISTLPLGWRPMFFAQGGGAALGVAAANLERVARHLADLEQRRSVCVHVDLEPEPGCALERASDVTGFFSSCLRPGTDGDRQRRYIRVCHDICHSAVMFEDQAEALAAYRAAGIRVGKVQVSSAVECDGSERGFRLLRALDEPRWLHQTCVLEGTGEVRFFADLEAAMDSTAHGVWRTHFHVPVSARALGALGTTQRQITDCFAAIRPEDGISHFEVETYAWSALPMEHRGGGLAESIAAELRWTREALASAGLG